MNSFTIEMAHKRTEMKKFMTSQGFILVRGKNHLVWRDEFGHQVVTPQTTSDGRCHKNLERTLKKIQLETQQQNTR